MSSSFGSAAASYAARLPDELDLVIFDDSGFAEALDASIARAARGGPFLCAPILGDRRAKAAFDAVRHIVVTHHDYWRRRECLELVRLQQFSFAGKTQVEHEQLSKKEKDSTGDVILAADGLLVRSWADLARISRLLDVFPVRSFRALAPPRVSVPAFRPCRGAKSIVVWAPDLDAAGAAMFGLALEELKSPIVIACADAKAGAALGLRARFIDWTDTDAVDLILDQAAAIIDASPDDPGAAVALAECGLPLAASFPSGVHEYVDGVHLYDPWDFRSILRAALAALGGEPPLARGDIPRPHDLIAQPPCFAPPVVADPPLVTVIIPTLNRHGILSRAIESVTRQTYPNVELVMINDGGEPVDAFVSHIPRVTVLNHEQPRGGEAALATALERVNGKYVVFLADDDYLFPTRISRSVHALERTGGAIAAGLCSDSYYEPGHDGAYDFIGTSIRPYRATDLTELDTVPVSMPTVLLRTDIAKELGIFDATARFYNDYDWTLRLADHGDFIWISALVLNMDTRLDRSNFSGNASLADRADDLARVWAHYPRANRPDIDTAREALMQLYRSNAPSPQHPMHRGVTRLAQPRRGVYRLRPAAISTPTPNPIRV